MSKLQTIKHEIFRATIFFGTGIALMSITYAAISWPSSAPSGEVVGGKYISKLVPTGFVGAFNLSACPTGWIAANGSNGTPDLRGEFIRGLDSGRGVDASRALATAQNATAINQSIYEARDIVYSDADSETTSTYSYYGVSNAATSLRKIFTVRPRNVALLYCVKN